MGLAAYLDDNILLGQSYVNHDDAPVHEKVLNDLYKYTYSLQRDGKAFCYDITKNIPLTNIYKFPCYVVKFCFSEVDMLHTHEQEEIMNELCACLYKNILSKNGYYNLRIPTHIVDLIRAVNGTFPSLIFCGGTVEEIHVGNIVESLVKDELNLYFADRKFAEQNKKKLEAIAMKSFGSYQGQYHISPVTNGRAGLIYGDWIGSYFLKYKENSVLIAEYKRNIVGYCAIQEDDIAVDVVLAAVDVNYRQLGAYKAMISTLIKYAKGKNKLFVTSTQFDNYIVQGVWNSLGLRPFYSIYNMHLDNRQKT